MSHYKVSGNEIRLLRALSPDARTL